MTRESQLIDLYDQYRTDPSPVLQSLRSYASGIKLVPGEGSTSPRVLIIGEAPGAVENLKLRPFVGASGRVIRALMAQCDLFTGEWLKNGIRQEANTFITNAVKYRPSARNRTPTDAEVDASRSYLRKEWAILGRPRIIVTAGRPALYAIMNQHLSLAKTVGAPQLLADGKTWVYPMYHPSFALHNEGFRPHIARQWSEFHDWLTKRDHDDDHQPPEH